MEKSLSDSDIRPYIPNIYLYEELADLTAKEVLERLPMAILFQEEENYGHWTLVHKTVEGIEFFDPYGIPPDKEFEDLEWKQPHYLAQYLYDLSKKNNINYNEYSFQARNNDTNTCGRWIILRSLFPHLSIDNFAQMIIDVSKDLGLTPDQLSVEAFTE